MRKLSSLALGGLAAMLLISCGQKRSPAADTSEPEAPATMATAWPASLNVFGAGYPKSGDPCRRVGESAATIDFLDDSAVLVGCFGAATDPDAAALLAAGGRAVGTVDGIILISIPQGDANVGMPAAPAETNPAEITNRKTPA